MSILTFMGITPLVGALLVLLVPSKNTELIKRVALLISLVVAVISILVAIRFDKGLDQFQFLQSNNWISAFNVKYAVGVDGISLVLILLSTILVPIVILATWHESDTGRWNTKVFYLLILILECLMIGVFAATDLFLFYVFFEAMLVPVYFLIGGFGSGNKSAAAVKFLLYSLFGGLLMLASIIGIYVISGNQIGATFDLAQLATLQIDDRTEYFLFLGFFIAFAIKAPLWPFHTWLPDAAKSATPGTSVLLLGVLDKVGTYGMIRFCIELFPDATKAFTPLIITLSVISIIYGAFMAIGQRDIKGLIAFTSISHFGFITMGIFAMTSQGMSGATLYMVNHGFSTAALFLIAGWMIWRRGSSTISDFGGLQRVTPVMAWGFFIAGMSSLALPGLSSFVSEFLVLVGTYTRYPIAAIIGTLGIVLAALYILIPVQKALHGPMVSGNEDLKDLNIREKVAISPVIIVIVIMGFYPKPVLDLINPTAEKIVTSAGYSDPVAKVDK